MEKTKAHRTKEAAKAADDLYTWHGDDWADTLAKAAANQGLASQVYQDAQDRVLKYWPWLIRSIATMFALWPMPQAAFSSGSWTKRIGPRPRTVKHWARHDWHFVPELGRFRCLTCLRTSTIRRQSKCPGPNVEHPLGGTRKPHEFHNMYTLCDHSTGSTVWYCADCGRFTQTRLQLLALQCPGPCEQKTPTWYPLERLRCGFHPIRHVHMGVPVKGIHAPKYVVPPIPPPGQPRRKRKRGSFFYDDDSEAPPFVQSEARMHTSRSGGTLATGSGGAGGTPSHTPGPQPRAQAPRPQQSSSSSDPYPDVCPPGFGQLGEDHDEDRDLDLGDFFGLDDPFAL